MVSHHSTLRAFLIEELWQRIEMTLWLDQTAHGVRCREMSDADGLGLYTLESMESRVKR